MTIVYAADNNYVFATAVSIESMLQAADKNIDYRIYVFSDSTLNDKSMELLEKIEERHRNCRIEIVRVCESIFQKADIHCMYLTKSALYRLIIAQLLPDEDICVYLDSDTLICSDISNILDGIDINNCIICGVKDTVVQQMEDYIRSIGIPAADTYVNSGVLVMNLQMIRKYNLTESFLNEIANDYLYIDQDILNKLCYGKIGVLDSGYNFFNVNHIKNEKVKLIHFAGVPDVKPWNNLRCRNADIWWSVAECFRGTEYFKKARKEAEDYTEKKDNKELFGQCVNADKVYIWGYTEESQKLCDALLCKGVKAAGFIDSDGNKHGMVYKEVSVNGSEILSGEKEAVVINAVQWHRKEVNSALREMGWNKSRVLQYYPKTKEYYQVLDEKYVKGEFNEIMDWQYDIKCAACAAEYDQLINIAQKCVNKITYSQLRRNKNMAVISVIDETRFKNFVDGLLECNSDINLIIVAQDYMENAFRETYGRQFCVIGWHGRYTAKLIDRISEETGNSGIDSFAFFSEIPINLRDSNYIEIARKLKENSDVNVYSVTVGNELYEYKNILLYQKSLQLYQDINEVMDLYFEKAEWRQCE